MDKRIVVILSATGLFLIGLYSAVLEPSLTSYSAITCDCAKQNRTTNSTCERDLRNARQTIRGMSELRFEEILVELTNMNETRRNLLLTKLKRNTRTMDDNVKIKAKSDFVNGSRIVYDEYFLLDNLKKIHNSRYTPPINETCRKRMPQSVILGMKKCGTQELIDFLTLHPNIVRRGKPVYEIGCFSSKVKFKKCRYLMPCSYSDQITMTKNSEYFTNPKVLERLRTFNKALKMIVLVREPVERLISDYSFEFFQKASKYGSIRFADDSAIYQNMTTLDARLVNASTGRLITSMPEIVRSTYDVAMKQFLRLFKRNQLLVIESKEMKSKPFEVLQRVETFLGLNHQIQRSDLVFNPEKGFYCLKIRGGMSCYGDNRGRQNKGGGKLKISEKTTKLLRSYFKVHNENFFRLIGERFDW